jgi:hypothetical protein
MLKCCKCRSIYLPLIATVCVIGCGSEGNGNGSNRHLEELMDDAPVSSVEGVSIPLVFDGTTMKSPLLESGGTNFGETTEIFITGGAFSTGGTASFGDTTFVDGTGTFQTGGTISTGGKNHGTGGKNHGTGGSSSTDYGSGTLLARWTFDDCDSTNTYLFDSTYQNHPAFRAVSALCVDSKKSLGIRLRAEDDIVYSPDQPDYDFRHGLTISAWINPERVTGIQNIARKRLDETSAFAMIIDGNQLRFIVRTENGALSNVATPIAAGNFSYVAGTFDGTKIQLYVNGKVVASAKACGEMASGVGPIFIGNDASGRLFKGIIDDVLVSNAAMSLDNLKDYACAHDPLTAEVSPANGPAVEPETPVEFECRIANPNDPLLCRGPCFWSYPSTPWPIYAQGSYYTEFCIEPGQTTRIPFTLAAYDVPGTSGAYGISFDSYDYSNGSYLSASATFNLLPSRCIRTPPVVSLTPTSQLGAGPGVAMPFVMRVTNTNSPEFCRVGEFYTTVTLPWPFGIDLSYVYSIAPGDTLDIPFNVTLWDGYGVPPGNVTFQVGVYESDYSIQSLASATLEYPLHYTFDSDLEGWKLSTWFRTEPDAFVNLAGNPPLGATPPELSHDAENGAPNPGSLKVTIPFSDWGQLVDTIVKFPWPFGEVDLTGKTLHANVRLHSGSLSRGGLYIHAHCLPDWVWADGALVVGSDLVKGVWVPVSFNTSQPRGTTGDFDPSRVVQIGIEIVDGPRSSSEVFNYTEPTVIEIDSVTD